MLLSGIATLAAFLLVGLGSKSERKSPLFMIGGFAAFALSIYFHVVAYQTVLQATSAISAEIGIGFLLLAGLLTKERKEAKSYFYLGGVSLLVSVLLFISIKFFSPSSDQSTVSFLLELGPDDSISEVQSILDSFDAVSEAAFPSVSLEEDENLAQTYLVFVASGQIEGLMQELGRDSENVDHTELNFSVSLSEPMAEAGSDQETETLLENDPLAPSQWALNAIHGHEAHAILKDLSPVRKARVAILDTGVDAAHEDLNSAFSNSPATFDLHGHGSHCAGIAGSATNNGIGMASLNWEGRFIEILGYQALNDQGTGTIEMISQAIIDATKDKADVISMSLGAKAETPKVISDAIAFARRNNVIVIASAGNANEDAKDHMPSSVEGVIVVSAVDENLEKAKFSNTNTSLKRPITAPGVNILSLKTGGGYVQMSGTSMSTPVVSGLVGIMRSLNPDLTESEVYDILESTGRSVRDSARIGKLIDSEAAITTVLNTK
jgi:thermitase